MVESQGIVEPLLVTREVIEGRFGNVTVRGAHLVPPELARYPENQGDGHLIIQGGDGSFFVAAIDISLGGGGGSLLVGNVLVGDDRVINETGLLKELKSLINKIVVKEGIERSGNGFSQTVLEIVSEKFAPGYLAVWRTGSDLGFSICTAFLSPNSQQTIDVASLGTNFVAKPANLKGVFNLVLGKNATPFSMFPDTKWGRKPPVGGKIHTDRILLATDGINVKRNLLTGSRVDINQPVEKLQRRGEEGLYLVVSRRTIDLEKVGVDNIQE